MAAFCRRLSQNFERLGESQVSKCWRCMTHQAYPAAKCKNGRALDAKLPWRTNFCRTLQSFCTFVLPCLGRHRFQSTHRFQLAQSIAH
jgi:hypothetical protein